MNDIGSMPAKQRRAAERYLREENLKWPEQLKEVPREAWPSTSQPKLFRVWRSRGFIVQVFNEADGVTRLSINRTTILDSGRWGENIPWETLQRLKAEAGFGNLDAVEVYPADPDVVNDANMRHLWILPYKLPFAWRCA